MLVRPWPFWVSATYLVFDKEDYVKGDKEDEVDMEVADNEEEEEVLIKVIKMVDGIILPSK